MTVYVINKEHFEVRGIKGEWGHVKSEDLINKALSGDREPVENGQENTIVISAETPEEAMETLLSCVSYEYEDEVLECYAEEIDWESYNAPHYYVYWSVADGHFSESEPQKLSEKRVVHKARR